jgi:hypothetical protein
MKLKLARRMIIRFTILAITYSLPSPIPAQLSRKPLLEARLTLPSRAIRNGQLLNFRIEIENVSDGAVLVGRNPNLIYNWPFRVELQLQNSAGQEFAVGHAGLLDAPPLADLSTENGILKWWIPLEPHTFMGIYSTLRLSGVPPGKYKLYGTYTSFPLRPLEASSVSGLSIFQGVVKTQPIWVEVLPES